MSDEEIYSSPVEVASLNIGSGGESIYSLGRSSKLTREESIPDEEAIVSQHVFINLH